MSDTTTAVVITSINEPTEAVRKFAAVAAGRLIVVGDLKSPSVWHCDGAEYLDTASQDAMDFETCRQLPWNHYSRKMAGYLHALSGGAQIVVDTDDDNIPKSDWAFPPFEGSFDTLSGDLGFINIYKLFTAQNIWPRGFPLRSILERELDPDRYETKRSDCRVGIWQGLADADPDVDAIYRLTIDRPCVFETRGPVVLPAGTACPFNSQNTAFRRDLATLLYLPAFVTFRFTDILRGLIAQCVLWSTHYRLGFLGATVVQERNPHDYLKDFESEIPCYLLPETVMEIGLQYVQPNSSVGANLITVYCALQKAGIVNGREIDLLGAWLRDLAQLGIE